MARTLRIQYPRLCRLPRRLAQLHPVDPLRVPESHPHAISAILESLRSGAMVEG